MWETPGSTLLYHCCNWYWVKLKHCRICTLKSQITVHTMYTVIYFGKKSHSIRPYSGLYVYWFLSSLSNLYAHHGLFYKQFSHVACCNFDAWELIWLDFRHKFYPMDYYNDTLCVSLILSARVIADNFGTCFRGIRVGGGVIYYIQCWMISNVKL